MQRKHLLGVFEEMDRGSKRRTYPKKRHHILNRKRNSSLILDPTIWFKNCEQQQKLVNEDKQKLSNGTIDHYTATFNIQNFKVIDLLIEGRGTI